MSPEVRAAITAKAASHRIEPELVAAIVAAESSGNPWRTQYEPGFHYYTNVPLWASRVGTTQITEQVGQSHSWGLMQVMGARARELGFKGLFPELCQAEVGLDFGCCDLKDLQVRFKDIPPPADDAPLAFSGALACSFNHGAPVRGPDGNWVVQAYVDKVEAFYREFKANGF